MINIKDLKVKTLEGLSVKNYQTFPSREWGEDGGMQADIYLNNIYVGRVYNAGDGGMGDMYFSDISNTSKSLVNDFKNACFNFLKRKDKEYFKYSFSPKTPLELNEDDYVSVVDLIASFYNKRVRTI